MSLRNVVLGSVIALGLSGDALAQSIEYVSPGFDSCENPNSVTVLECKEKKKVARTVKAAQRIKSLKTEVIELRQEYESTRANVDGLAVGVSKLEETVTRITNLVGGEGQKDVRDGSYLIASALQPEIDGLQRLSATSAEMLKDYLKAVDVAYTRVAEFNQGAQGRAPLAPALEKYLGGASASAYSAKELMDRVGKFDQAAAKYSAGQLNVVEEAVRRIDGAKQKFDDNQRVLEERYRSVVQTLRRNLLK